MSSPLHLNFITKHVLSTVLHALAEFSFLYIDKNNIISIMSLLKIQFSNEIDQFIYVTNVHKCVDDTIDMFDYLLLYIYNRMHYLRTRQ